MRFRRPRRVDDFSEEIQAHIALETDRLIGEGIVLKTPEPLLLEVSVMSSQHRSVSTNPAV
jgi:hypothetical protein